MKMVSSALNEPWQPPPKKNPEKPPTNPLMIQTSTYYSLLNPCKPLTDLKRTPNEPPTYLKWNL